MKRYTLVDLVTLLVNLARPFTDAIRAELGTTEKVAVSKAPAPEAPKPVPAPIPLPVVAAPELMPTPAVQVPSVKTTAPKKARSTKPRTLTMKSAAQQTKPARYCVKKVANGWLVTNGESDGGTFATRTQARDYARKANEFAPHRIAN